MVAHWVLRGSVNFLSKSLFMSALCSFLLCWPLPAQSSPENTSSNDASSSGSAAPGADSSNSADYNQTPSNGPTYGPNSCDVSQLKICIRDFWSDQAAIWTSPFHLHAHDALWLLPLAGATAVSLNYDVQTLQQVSTSPHSIRISNDFSSAGAYGAIGAAGAAYIIGKVTHNETARETGVLSLEAIADSGVVTEVLKLATNRQRPYMGTGQGHFWPDGSNIYTTNGSFPSGHATIIWSFSHVVADETPGHPWLHLGLYLVAAGVSAARVTSRNHFPSDVIVGSAIGYLVGGYVYRQHSDSYDGSTASSRVTVSPVYDTSTRSYGMGVTIDPNALRSVRLKELWSKAPRPRS